MQEQNNGDVGDFGWVQRKILEGLTRDGANPDHLAVLGEKIAAIELHLQTFRTKRRQLGDSGKYTRQGLEEAARELAAPIAGEIKRLLDTTHLKNNLAQKRTKLQPPATGDMADRIIAHFTMMELRTIYQAQGVNIAQGQQQRQATLNPMLAKEVRELETLHEQFQRITKDALQELPLPTPDPIAEVAAGQGT
jgi:hypothetical protein